jgi:cytochrome c oxidase subunit 2
MNTSDNLRRFIAQVDTLKPGAKMPAFGMLPPQELDAIVHYLAGLK